MDVWINDREYNAMFPAMNLDKCIIQITHSELSKTCCCIWNEIHVFNLDFGEGKRKKVLFGLAGRKEGLCSLTQGNSTTNTNTNITTLPLLFLLLLELQSYTSPHLALRVLFHRLAPRDFQNIVTNASLPLQIPQYNLRLNLWVVNNATKFQLGSTAKCAYTNPDFRITDKERVQR